MTRFSNYSIVVKHFKSRSRQQIILRKFARKWASFMMSGWILKIANKLVRKWQLNIQKDQKWSLPSSWEKNLFWKCYTREREERKEKNSSFHHHHLIFFNLSRAETDLSKVHQHSLQDRTNETFTRKQETSSGNC